MAYTGNLIALSTQSDTLIRAEVRAAEERELLEDAVRQAASIGYDVCEISAASGLTPAEIRRLLA